MRGLSKKAALLLTLCLMFTVFAGCGKKEQSATCTIERNGVAIEMVLDAEGDKVTKMTQTTISPLEGLDEDTAAELEEMELEEMLKQCEENYAAYDSVTYEYELSDTEMKETVAIDLEDKDELKELSDAGLLPIEGDADTISLKKNKEALEEAGWTVK